MHARHLIVGAFALAAPLAASAAQDTTATLTGHVTDSAGVALAGADLSVNRLGPRARTDAAGHFRISGILPGERVVLVRRPGYHSATLRLSLRRGETRDTTVRMAMLVVPLDTVVTEARATSENLRRTGFATRQRMGFGYFLDRDAIAHLGAFDVADIMRRVPFVQVSGGLGGRTLLIQPSACRPAIYLDGLPTPSVSDLPAEIVDGIEVYRHAIDVPLEFQRGRSPCGAVVIWTR